MRILTISHFYESHGGGIERVAGQICRALMTLGHEIGWAASHEDTAPEIKGLHVIRLKTMNPIEKVSGMPMPIPLPTAFGALKHAISQADIIIIHDTLYATSIAGLILARKHGKPVILIQHIARIPFAGKVMHHVMNLANDIIVRPMLRAAEQVIFISETSRNEFKNIVFKKPEKIIFNGVDSSVFYQKNPDYTSDIKINKRTKVSYVGRLVGKKGIFIIFELARLRPDVDFFIAGSGPVDPRDWALSNVHYMGVLDQKCVAKLYRSSDYLLLPSFGEGFPLVIQEAMACGLPVICDEGSANADPAASAWMHAVKIDPTDFEGTARRVSIVLDATPMDDDTRQKMASYASTHYSWKAMAEELTDIASSLTARG